MNQVHAQLCSNLLHENLSLPASFLSCFSVLLLCVFLSFLLCILTVGYSSRLHHVSHPDSFILLGWDTSEMSGYIFLASNIERIIIIWRSSNQRQPSRCVHCTCSNQIHSQRKEQMTPHYSERDHNNQNPCVGVYDVIYFPLLNHSIFL